MKLKRALSLRTIVTTIYVCSVVIYLFFGIQPADAATYEITGQLEIPAIGLTSDITTLSLENGELKTPDTIIGSYSRSDSKIFLVGHRSTVFKDLIAVRPGDLISYGNEKFKVLEMSIEVKESISMSKLLAPDKNNEKTLVLMTCAGESRENGDATHRLIITAKLTY